MEEEQGAPKRSNWTVPEIYQCAVLTAILFLLIAILFQMPTLVRLKDIKGNRGEVPVVYVTDGYLTIDGKVMVRK